MDSLAIKITKSKLQKVTQDLLFEQDLHPGLQELITSNFQKTASLPLRSRKRRARLKGRDILRGLGMTYKTFYNKLHQLGADKALERTGYDGLWGRNHRNALRWLKKKLAGLPIRVLKASNVNPTDFEGTQTYKLKVFEFDAKKNSWIRLGSGKAAAGDFGLVRTSILQFEAAATDNGRWYYVPMFIRRVNSAGEPIEGLPDPQYLFTNTEGVWNQTTRAAEAISILFPEEIKKETPIGDPEAEEEEPEETEETEEEEEEAEEEAEVPVPPDMPEEQRTSLIARATKLVAQGKNMLKPHPESALKLFQGAWKAIVKALGEVPSDTHKPWPKEGPDINELLTLAKEAVDKAAAEKAAAKQKPAMSSTEQDPCADVPSFGIGRQARILAKRKQIANIRRSAGVSNCMNMDSSKRDACMKKVQAAYSEACRSLTQHAASEESAQTEKEKKWDERSAARAKWCRENPDKCSKEELERHGINESTEKQFSSFPDQQKLHENWKKHLNKD